MSTSVTSRSFGINAFLAPGMPTLADVVRAVERAPALTAKQRADYASAVRKVADVLGLTPADVPAHPAFLRQRLAGIAPVAHGISKEHWANVRSRSLKALKIAGVTTLPGRCLAPLTPAWQELWDKLPSKRLRYGLSRLMRYASANGVDPPMVDDDFFARFRRALEEDSLLRHAKKSGRQALTFWNRAVEQVPDLPQRRLTVPARTDRYGLPWSAFPASLERDVEAWLARLAGSDPLEELPFRLLRPVTVELRRRQVRELASALVARGRDPASICSLADLARPEAAKAALRFFLERAPGGKPTLRMRYLVLCHAGSPPRRAGSPGSRAVRRIGSRPR